MARENKYDTFLRTYRGKELLKNHSLNEEGVWRIQGEDPNCDYGGAHHMPDLETVTGRLQDVIEYAVNLPRFWQWGAGGDIIKQKPPTRIDTAVNQARAADMIRIQQLESELKDLRKRNGL